MVLSNLRKLFRRQCERRDIDRRQLELIFMSPEWLNRIQKEYLLWPKADRRENERRNSLRRQKTRRKKSNYMNKAPRYTSQDDLLTQEEKQLINELIQQESSK